MRWKLVHSPIAFAEFCIKIICAGRQFYFNAELAWKLEKILVKTEPKVSRT
jgi:hypothetical protein